MNRIHVTLVCLWLILLGGSATAKEWQVGPTREYHVPSEVSTLVHDGDTVSIDAGVYARDVCSWSASGLLLRAVGGRADLQSEGLVYGGKAIWVIRGDANQIEHIAFFDARCVDKNGAGIRLEGHHAVIRHCLFRHNENGILSSKTQPSTVVIEYCEFDGNGAGDGYSHNLYIGGIDSLIFRFNYSHHAKVGHELKSRASTNIISYNRISNEQLGTASRCIDLPNGGLAIINGNVIQQGPLTENSNVAEFGLEGLTNPSPHKLFLAHNTFVNNREQGATFWQVAEGCDLVQAENNVVVGVGNWLGSVIKAKLVLDRSTLRLGSNLDSEFNNISAYDYRLKAHSSARNAGQQSATPECQVSMVYEHPCAASTRCIEGAPDAGAYEFCALSSVAGEAMEDSSSDHFPNPVQEQLYFKTVQSHIELFDMRGCPVAYAHNTISIYLGHIANGVYTLNADGQCHRILIVH